jgi:3-oxoacyl-[acyl-carrier-protein] synthase III
LLGGGTLHRPNTTLKHPELNLFHMDGPAIFKHAARTFPPFLRGFLTDIGWEISSIKALVPHQASGHGVKSISSRLGFTSAQVVLNLPLRGNCIAASIPLALTEVFESGRIQRGDRVLLAGTAAGLTLGTVALVF